MDKQLPETTILMFRRLAHAEVGSWIGAPLHLPFPRSWEEAMHCHAAADPCLFSQPMIAMCTGTGLMAMGINRVCNL